ncbi:putative glutaredoxin [Neoconidiobolus thromboides FSU 785]|nr:putative glutaredoxin [Neoconidiobolus thromboides FSU 785]
MSVKALVDRAISSGTIVIFSKTYCPYCTKAKQFASTLGAPVEVIELDTRDDGSEIQSYLLDLTKQRTVPNVFVKGQHIGGCDDFTSSSGASKVKALLA